jgi:hypothetical protein
MARHLAMDGVDLLEGPADGFGGSVAVGIGPDREEDAADMAGAHAGDIDLPEVMLLGEVVPLVENHLGGVVMQVDNHGALEQARDACRIGARLGQGSEGHRHQEDELEHDARIAHDRRTLPVGRPSWTS